MRQVLPNTTSRDEAERAAGVAVLPVGSFEQHGDHLPLATDTLIACAIASAISATYDVMLLPPITISCSHEHARWPGTVSISASTLQTIIDEIAASLESSGVRGLLLVNGHGGNYVLSNIVQQASITRPAMALFPARDDWNEARRAAELVTDNHDDMHAGELETSILLHAFPDVVRDGYQQADHQAPDRRLLTTLGIGAYTTSGVIGRPSLATPEKGSALLTAFTELAAPYVETLRGS